MQFYENDTDKTLHKKNLLSELCQFIENAKKKFSSRNYDKSSLIKISLF